MLDEKYKKYVTEVFSCVVCGGDLNIPYAKLNYLKAKNVNAAA